MGNRHNFEVWEACRHRRAATIRVYTHFKRWMRVVLIGERFEVDHAMGHPSMAPTSDVEIVGAVHIVRGEGPFPERAIRELVLGRNVDTLMVVGRLTPSSLTSFGELAVVLGCQLLSFSPHGDSGGGRPVVIWRASHHVSEVPLPSEDGWFDQAKRTMDIVLAATGLLCTVPFIALVALAVRLESPGNPFFGHVRIGVGGRRFRCWKLRTMHVDAERHLNQVESLLDLYKTNGFRLPDEQDPRITRVGRFLRRTSFDELPQLWNVLVGEMSLVGPRPIVAEELKHYAGEILTLLSVRPGITGAWAVNGRHQLAYPQRAQLELQYIRSRSIANELRILWRTVGAVIGPMVGKKPESCPAPRTGAPEQVLNQG